MVDCEGFKDMLLDDRKDELLASASVQKHIKACGSCQKLYEADHSLEAALEVAMKPVAPPPEMIARARRRVASESAVGWRIPFGNPLRLVAVGMASALAAILLVINPFSAQLDSVNSIVTYSIANHMEDVQPMAIETDSAHKAAVWFSDRLGFDVKVPDLSLHGLSLMGGRKCSLGKTKAAYLYCDASGKRASLFLMNASEVDIALENREYRIKQGTHEVKIWKEAGIVCALVV